MAEASTGDAPLNRSTSIRSRDAAVADVLPLTEPQREMWAAAPMGDEANCAYNQCFALTLHGPLRSSPCTARSTGHGPPRRTARQSSRRRRAARDLGRRRRSRCR